MNPIIDSILKVEVQNFILSHENEDVQQLLLRHRKIHGVAAELIAQQIIGRRKAKAKLPSWFGAKQIVYPPSLNLEQSSSEATAKFKSGIIQSLISGEKSLRIADLTGGLGVDSYFFSRRVHEVDFIEPHIELLEIAQHNHGLLGANNIVYHPISAESFLQSPTGKQGIIYLDPSRRKARQKVFRLTDSQPDVVGLQPEILSKAEYALIKTSPLLDLQQGCRELHHVAQIVIVAVENECKELLFLLQRAFSGEPVVVAVDLDSQGEILNRVTFTRAEEVKSVAAFSAPLTYLYEPNVTILKGGAFKWVAQHYELKKLAVNTHLYTSVDQRDFPGRVFKIVSYVKLNKKLKAIFTNGHANILTRNYPISVEEIKKKTGLKEGGELYLICTQDVKEKLVMVAERVR